MSSASRDVPRVLSHTVFLNDGEEDYDTSPSLLNAAKIHLLPVPCSIRRWKEDSIADYLKEHLS